MVVAFAVELSEQSTVATGVVSTPAVVAVGVVSCAATGERILIAPTAASESGAMTAAGLTRQAGARRSMNFKGFPFVVWNSAAIAAQNRCAGPAPTRLRDRPRTLL